MTNTSADLQGPISQLLPKLSEEDTAVLLAHLPRLSERLNHLKSAFRPDVQHSVAIKSNPHPRLLKTLVEHGLGLEAASIEEVRLALSAGCLPQRVVFDSPVKTRLELAEVSQLPNLLVNVNTLGELERFPTDAQCMIGVRVNPLTHTGSPEIFSVGRNESKFGVPIAHREAIIQAALRYPVKALHMHSGSQMRDLKAQQRALRSLGVLAQEINQALQQAQISRQIECIDIGGGLPSEALSAQSQMRQYGELVHGLSELKPFKIVTEFGQWVHAECGLALSRVEYVVDGQPPKLFIHLGADMFTRDAYTQPRPFPLSLWSQTGQRIQSAPVEYDVAGPLCFAGDYLARQVSLPVAQEGHWLCVDHTGANTYALWSRHCSRDVPAQWAWDGEQLQQWGPRQAILY